MRKLQWQAESIIELSTLLTQATLENSAAVGTSTVYHILHDGQEKLAISLPDGQALIIELADAPQTRRRRRDPVNQVNLNTDLRTNLST